MLHAQAILTLTFPFFALILCGYLAARRGTLPLAVIPGLSTYVLFFALPAMLFRFGATIPLANLFNWPLITLFTLSAFILISLSIVFSRNKRIGLKDAALGALVTAFPNSGFLGVPLILALLGENAMAVVMASMIVDLFFSSTICLTIAEMPSCSSSQRSMRALIIAFTHALKRAASNPMPWAIAGGALLAWSGMQIPGPVDKTLALLSNSASPVALFTIGAMLARNALIAKHATPPIDYVPVALAKLIAHPLLILLGAWFAQWLGYSFSAAVIAAAILVASLPSASNVSMLAEHFGADTDRIAKIILVSTALSFFTFSATVWLLGIQPIGQ